MSQAVDSTIITTDPNGSSEKDATYLARAQNPLTRHASAPKLRSCLTCRSRKVRCDKQSPCSNCRRADVLCTLPSSDRPPRWARRLQRSAETTGASNVLARQDAGSSVDGVMDRLYNLEALVKELRGQLEQAHATSASNSPESTTQHSEPQQHEGRPRASETSGLQKQFGRLVLQDANRSRYVSSAFWSRVDDELNGLKTDTRSLTAEECGSSADEASQGALSSTYEQERAPSELHSFLFGHNLNPRVTDLKEFQPLPSQVHFLLDVFSENVNIFTRAVHIPSVMKMVRYSRGGGMTDLRPSHEALLFSIYYAAIVSMEEDDVMTNFNSSKTELSLKYRLGLEYALAKADFLNAPDLTLVQAFATFLCLARRHDSPRLVYMLVGLLIRMSQFLGLQRDGARFSNLSPFEVEMRRRVWWTVSMLDLRASEDQGCEIAIAHGSFDTKIPLNYNEADLDSESKQLPTERHGVTDMSFTRISAGMTEIMRQMTMAINTENSVAGLQDQSRLVNEIYQKFEQEYLQYTTEAGGIVYWVAVSLARLIMAKMTLIVFLPVLLTSPAEHISDEIRTKLLVSAVEVAEYNHALNAEEGCRGWRWIYQSHTHWHAIVFLLLEISRRSWSPFIERAWTALHSPWLIPAQTPADNRILIWIPLRKLMVKAGKHRDKELRRLRSQPEAVARLEMEDEKIPLPSSLAIVAEISGKNTFRDQWRQLVTTPEEIGKASSGSDALGAGFATNTTSRSTPSVISAQRSGISSSNLDMEPTYHHANGQQAQHGIPDTNGWGLNVAYAKVTPSTLTSGQTMEPSYHLYPTVPFDGSDSRPVRPGFFPWLWADADPSVEVVSGHDTGNFYADMDLDSDMNWC